MEIKLPWTFALPGGPRTASASLRAICRLTSSTWAAHPRIRMGTTLDVQRKFCKSISAELIR
jgi:hypothetical protein